MGIFDSIRGIQKVAQATQKIDWKILGIWVYLLWIVLTLFSAIVTTADIVNKTDFDFFTAFIAGGDIKNNNITWTNIITSPLLHFIYEIITPIVIGLFVALGFKSSKIQSVSDKYNQYFEHERNNQ